MSCGRDGRRVSGVAGAAEVTAVCAFRRHRRLACLAGQARQELPVCEQTELDERDDPAAVVDDDERDDRERSPALAPRHDPGKAVGEHRSAPRGCASRQSHWRAAAGDAWTNSLRSRPPTVGRSVACTLLRAWPATILVASVDWPRIRPISPNGTAHRSYSTNATRSRGPATRGRRGARSRIWRSNSPTAPGSPPTSTRPPMRAWRPPLSRSTAPVPEYVAADAPDAAGNGFDTSPSIPTRVRPLPRRFVVPPGCARDSSLTGLVNRISF